MAYGEVFLLIMTVRETFRTTQVMIEMIIILSASGSVHLYIRTYLRSCFLEHVHALNPKHIHVVSLLTQKIIFCLAYLCVIFGENIYNLLVHLSELGLIYVEFTTSAVLL